MSGAPRSSRFTSRPTSGAASAIEVPIVTAQNANWSHGNR